MKYSLFTFLILLSFSVKSQSNLSELLDKFNTESVTYITVDSLNEQIESIIVLDAREENEYNISHIENATLVGYSNFKLKKIKKLFPDKNITIVVYCSLGIRSEDISERLVKGGYKNVFNLYGGIFEWKNNNYNVYDSKGNKTEKIHAFDKEWGQWLIKGIKVYE